MNLPTGSGIEINPAQLEQQVEQLKNQQLDYLSQDMPEAYGLAMQGDACRLQARIRL